MTVIFIFDLLLTNVQCCENKILRYIRVCYMVWAQYVFWCKMEENILNGIQTKEKYCPFQSCTHTYLSVLGTMD